MVFKSNPSSYLISFKNWLNAYFCYLDSLNIAESENEFKECTWNYEYYEKKCQRIWICFNYRDFAPLKYFLFIAKYNIIKYMLIIIIYVVINLLFKI